MLLEGITLEEAKEMLNDYKGPSSLVLYTAEFLKSKSDKIAKSYIDDSLHKLYAEINKALIAASDKGEYSVTIRKNTLEKYKPLVIQEAIAKLKEVGYKVEYLEISPTYPGLGLEKRLIIKWD